MSCAEDSAQHIIVFSSYGESWVLRQIVAVTIMQLHGYCANRWAQTKFRMGVAPHCWRRLNYVGMVRHPVGAGEIPYGWYATWSAQMSVRAVGARLRVTVFDLQATVVGPAQSQSRDKGQATQRTWQGGDNLCRARARHENVFSKRSAISVSDRHLAFLQPILTPTSVRLNKKLSNSIKFAALVNILFSMISVMSEDHLTSSYKVAMYDYVLRYTGI